MMSLNGRGWANGNGMIWNLFSSFSVLLIYVGNSKILR